MCSLNIQTTPPSFPKPPIAVGMTGIAPLDHVRAIPTAWKMAGNSHGDFGDLLGFFSAVRPKTRIAYAVRLNQKRQDRAAKKTIDDQLRAMRGPDYRLGMIPEQLHSLEKVSDSYGSPLCIDRSSPPPQQIALARACVLQKTETVRRCYPVNIDANDFDLLLSALQMLESAQASLGADAVTQGFDNYQRHRTLPQIGERVVTLEYRRWLDYLVRCL
ncbi:MAG TPA: hypothetical protein VJC18_02850, partial [bacterium]|nr:hypothetical protein [bacterium]